jgi:hypothetical protein
VQRLLDGRNGQGVVGGKIELTAQGRKVNGENTTNLHWRGATSSDIDVFRSQQGGGGFTLIATTPNNGSYQDSTGTTGKASFKYKVCEAGTQTAQTRGSGFQAVGKTNQSSINAASGNCRTPPCR